MDTIHRGSKTQLDPQRVSHGKQMARRGISLGLGEALTAAFHRFPVLPDNSPWLLNRSPVRNFSAIFDSLSVLVCSHHQVMSVLLLKRLSEVLLASNWHCPISHVHGLLLGHGLFSSISNWPPSLQFLPSSPNPPSTLVPEES